jgi:ElaA protein
MAIEWVFKQFADLAPYELYAVLQLRNEVFVVEQNCIFQDADDKDQESWHLLGFENKKLAAYTRIVPPGVIYIEPSIGRVVTSPSVRRKGWGKVLMEESIRRLHALYPGSKIKIGAQLYLKIFYESFGFRQVSETYMEDGIPHICMLMDELS